MCLSDKQKGQLHNPHPPSFKVCDKCPAMLDDVKPEHWANLLMKNTAVCYCSSESCGFFCLECEKKVHCEKITGSDETLGETSGHRTFRFDTKAASLKSMDCSSLFDATRACNDWVTKLKDRQKKILELGTQLSSLSEEVENTTKHWYALIAHLINIFIRLFCGVGVLSTIWIGTRTTRTQTLRPAKRRAIPSRFAKVFGIFASQPSFPKHFRVWVSVEI